MDQFTEAIKNFSGVEPITTERLLWSAAILAGLLLVRMLVLRGVTRWTDDVTRRYYARRTVSYVFWVLAILLIGRLWFHGLHDLAVFMGLASAGLLIALQDSVMNIAGWIFIILRRPFHVGDRIEIGAVKGDVIDLRLFQFSVVEIGNWVAADQSTGRIIHIPNGKVFKDPLANYTQGFEHIWHELPVLVTFESDWEDAKRILSEIAQDKAEKFSKTAERQIRKAAEKYMIFYKNLTPIVYTSVADSGVLLTIRYLTRARTRRGTEEQIWEEILRRFAARNDIDFAYPTTRYYDNPIEGKPGARAEPPPRA